MTKENKEEIKPCPFCGGHSQVLSTDSLGSDDGYCSGTPSYNVICSICGSRGQTVYYKWFRDTFSETVNDFRRNPSLRAKRDDEYEDIRNAKKLEAVKFWNRRTKTNN